MQAALLLEGDVLSQVWTCMWDGPCGREACRDERLMMHISHAGVRSVRSVF